MTKQSNLTTCQTTWLVLLRVAIGWHFLYEGLIKIFNPSWTPFGYLMDSKGIFAPMFQAMASDPSVLKSVAIMNEWGLILIGTGLIAGLFTRAAIWSGMILLSFYYLSHPPLPGLSYALPSEGSYFIIDKVVIEFLALGVLALFPTGLAIGLDRLIFGSSLKIK
jgi:thiosulfate dehydrogenase [quinone] large subunit